MFDLNLKKTKAQIEAAKFVEEAYRLVKIYNPRVLMAWGAGDLSYVTDEMAHEYLTADLEGGKAILGMAMQEFKRVCDTKADVTFGDFKRTAYAMKTYRSEEIRSTHLIGKQKSTTPSNAKENIIQLKKMLRGAFKRPKQ